MASRGLDKSKKEAIKRIGDEIITHMLSQGTDRIDLERIFHDELTIPGIYGDSEFLYDFSDELIEYVINHPNIKNDPKFQGIITRIPYFLIRKYADTDAISRSAESRTVRHRDGDEISDDVCSICLDPLTSNTMKTPCSHVFHKACYEKFKRSREAANAPLECPLCRAPLRRGGTKRKHSKRKKTQRKK